jgi:hypothetical protein
MRELRKSWCQRVSIRYSVICATLGLMMALLLVALILGTDAIGREIFRDSSVIAIVALYAAALILGLVAGGLISRIGVHDPRIWLMGIGLAWSCLLISVLAGSSVNFFSEKHNAPSGAEAFTDWIIKPLFWIVLLGGLPALGLGLFYAARVRKALSAS